MNNITNSFFQIIIACFLGIGILACSSTQIIKENPLQTIKDPTLKSTLDKAFTSMGGLENWNNKASLRFRKKTILYLANGEIEKSSDQIHFYENLPTNKVTISWEADQDSHIIQMIDGKVSKMVNQKVDESANTTSLKSTVAAATFVMGVPFKLMDEGASLSYEGIQTIQSGKEVHVVKATYNPVAFKNHTKSDIWWHYFDKNTHEQVGYMVRLNDHNSYIENLTFERVGGFLFTTSRKSWRVDENGEKLYVRAEYEYSDFEVR